MVHSFPMAEFPPNLDDGELWLPSDIFINEVPSSLGSFSCMNDDQLARHFAALSFLQNHRPRPSSNLAQRVKPELGDFPVNRLPPPGCFHCHGSVERGQRLVGYESTSPFARSTFCDFPVQPQVPSYLEKRAWLTQRQESRQQLTRVNSFRGREFGFRSVGFTRDSGGTGVFHPRVVPTTVTTSTASDVRKKQGLRNRQEMQATRPRNYMTRESSKKLQEDCCYYLPPEMGLPQDWTY